MREIKFRAWDGQRWIYRGLHDRNWYTEPKGGLLIKGTHPRDKNMPTCEYTGLKDKNEQEYYIGDIGRFNNGDTFILKMEDWLEVYADWIGDVKCEDQTRDLYRIERAIIIGNNLQNPELLEK